MPEDSTQLSRLKVGLVLPPFEDATGLGHRWATLLAIARHAEDIGFDSIWVPDHLILREPNEVPRGAWEGWTVLTALAASTSRVEIGSFVLCTAWRNPALIAKMADTLDEISNGRLILGLGAGWHEPEFHAFGFPVDQRYERFSESLTIIHGLLRNGEIDFDGKYTQVRDCELRPRGPRSDGPPIMIGTTGPKMLRLTARFATHWNVFGRNQPHEIAILRAAVDEACGEVGRDPETLGRTAAVMVNSPGYPSHFAATPDSPALSGSPEELAMQIRGHVEQGINHVQILLSSSDQAGVDAFAPVLDVLDKG